MKIMTRDKESFWKTIKSMAPAEAILNVTIGNYLGPQDSANANKVPEDKLNKMMRASEAAELLDYSYHERDIHNVKVETATKLIFPIFQDGDMYLCAMAKYALGI